MLLVLVTSLLLASIAHGQSNSANCTRETTELLSDTTCGVAYVAFNNGAATAAQTRTVCTTCDSQVDSLIQTCSDDADDLADIRALITYLCTFNGDNPCPISAAGIAVTAAFDAGACTAACDAVTCAPLVQTLVTDYGCCANAFYTFVQVGNAGIADVTYAQFYESCNVTAPTDCMLTVAGGQSPDCIRDTAELLANTTCGPSYAAFTAGTATAAQTRTVCTTCGSQVNSLIQTCSDDADDLADSRALFTYRCTFNGDSPCGLGAAGIAVSTAFDAGTCTTACDAATCAPLIQTLVTNYACCANAFYTYGQATTPGIADVTYAQFYEACNVTAPTDCMLTVVGGGGAGAVKAFGIVSLLMAAVAALFA